MSGTVSHRKNVEYAHDVGSVIVDGRQAFPVQVDGDVIGLRERVSIGLAPGAVSIFA